VSWSDLKSESYVLERAPNWPGRTMLQQDPSVHVQSCFFFLYISLVYISLVYISPLFLYLPCLYLPRTLGLSLFYTLSSHPRTAGHATSPGTQLQLIRAAGANLHQIGFTCILVHLRSSQDVCGLYEEVRCKSYDLAAVPGAFGTAATPAPHTEGNTNTNEHKATPFFPAPEELLGHHPEQVQTSNSYSPEALVNTLSP
jgi:hypothetical protein